MFPFLYNMHILILVSFKISFISILIVVIFIPVIIPVLWASPVFSYNSSQLKYYWRWRTIFRTMKFWENAEDSSGEVLRLAETDLNEI